ncbi:transposase [candidate division KSB1 bacterium]|nr:transposase [candidate division KSB1 bacterium]
MKYDPYIHHRRSIRLKGYDYSQAGAYFVTICTHNHECIFGEIIHGQMALNDAGRVVQTVWVDLPNHYPNIELDEYVVMPNHVHGIIVIVVGPDFKPAHVVGAGFKPAPTTTRPDFKPAPTTRHGLPEIVRACKTFSARRINQMRGMPGAKLWQRNYYEHIIRNENELNRIRKYIINNPMKWDLNRKNPNRNHQ